MSELSAYDYDLPDELIAQTPLTDRAASRLLVLNRQNGSVEHRVFRDLPKILRPGDLLVLNDAKVTAVRLLGVRESGGKVEALLLGERGPGLFEALVKPGRRVRTGARVEFVGGLAAKVESVLEGGGRLLRFEPRPDLVEALAAVGKVPLPPYVHAELDDPGRYQTVMARAPGSAAAPTAGLHFTLELLEELKGAGVSIATVTLDVGIDTFRPIQTENLSAHRMHGEVCEVSKEAAEAIRACRGRVIAVGTTSVRTLESFAAGPGEIEPGRKVSNLFIRPGFRFQVVQGMLTNFHLPRTSMLVMLAAIASREAVLEAYRQAIERRYRFLSFGDAMAIL